MNLKDFVTGSLPRIWIYVMIAVPAMATTIYAAWLFAAVVPRVIDLLSFRRYRFGQYVKDVHFRQAWLSRRLLNRHVSRVARMVRQIVIYLYVWLVAWIPGPPRGLPEIDSTDIELAEEGDYEGVNGPETSFPYPLA